MKVKYPRYYEEYNKFCRKTNVEEALGGSLLIDSDLDGNKNPTEQQITKILQATKQSLISLISQIQDDRNNNVNIRDIHMPKINSGYFGVPRQRTEQETKNIDINYPYTVYIHML